MEKPTVAVLSRGEAFELIKLQPGPQKPGFGASVRIPSGASVGGSTWSTEPSIFSLPSTSGSSTGTIGGATRFTTKKKLPMIKISEADIAATQPLPTRARRKKEEGGEAREENQEEEEEQEEEETVDTKVELKSYVTDEEEEDTIVSTIPMSDVESQRTVAILDGGETFEVVNVHPGTKQLVSCSVERKDQNGRADPHKLSINKCTSPHRFDKEEDPGQEILKRPTTRSNQERLNNSATPIHRDRPGVLTKFEESAGCEKSPIDTKVERSLVERVTSKEDGADFNDDNDNKSKQTHSTADNSESETSSVWSMESESSKKAVAIFAFEGAQVEVLKTNRRMKKLAKRLTGLGGKKVYLEYESLAT